METITIGKLADAAGVNVQTVRYYERRGLLPQPARRPSGYREYPKTDIGRLGFIRRAQGLGFTLAEIEELLSLKVDPETTPEQVHGRVKEKISNVAARIAELEEIQDALSHMAAACTRHGLAGDCPFLDALSDDALLRGDGGAHVGPSPRGDASRAASPIRKDETMTTTMDTTTKTVLRSDELSCPSCVSKIEKALRALPGVESATVRFNSGRIDVAHDQTKVSVERLVNTIKDAGYDAEPSAF